MSSLTTLNVKNSHILVGIYFILLKIRPRLNLKDFQNQIRIELSEKIGKVVINKDKFKHFFAN